MPGRQRAEPLPPQQPLLPSSEEAGLDAEGRITSSAQFADVPSVPEGPELGRPPQELRDGNEGQEEGQEQREEILSLGPDEVQQNAPVVQRAGQLDGDASTRTPTAEFQR